MNDCPGCGARFECGAVSKRDSEPCWCMRLPPVQWKDIARIGGGRDDNRCFCPACLASSRTPAPG